jgi:DNA-binding MarR family transcriptional regulator
MVRDVVTLSSEYLLILEKVHDSPGISETRLQYILEANKGKHGARKNALGEKNSLSAPTVTRRRKELSAWGYIKRKAAGKRGIREIIFTERGKELYDDFLVPLRASTEQFKKESSALLQNLSNQETLSDDATEGFLDTTLIFFANIIKCGGSSLLLETNAIMILLPEIVKASDAFKKVMFLMKERKEYGIFLREALTRARTKAPMLKFLEDRGFNLLGMLGF